MNTANLQKHAINYKIPTAIEFVKRSKMKLIKSENASKTNDSLSSLSLFNMHCASQSQQTIWIPMITTTIHQADT